VAEVATAERETLAPELERVIEPWLPWKPDAPAPPTHQSITRQQRSRRKALMRVGGCGGSCAGSGSAGRG
jgi:hypothetical protein